MKFFSKNNSRFIEYVLLLFLENTIRFLPRNIALFCGSIAGKTIYHCGFYRNIVKKNMKHVELWNTKQMDEIIYKLYINIGRYTVDFLRSSKNKPPFKIYNSDLLDKSFSRKKGIMILLAHFGNWELLADIFGEKISNLNVVAKKMKNRNIDSWLAKKRSRTSVKTIYTDHALRKMLDVLRKNGMVAILIDQHAGKHGTMVPFLGKEANTVRTMAGIVSKTKCSVLSAYAIIDEHNNYRIVIKDVPAVSADNISEEKRIFEYQKIHNEVISEWIREYPQHWFGWFHKRFKETVKYKSL
jgi:Kdo2-lipid IVA lauroyltransferase/acyltransferase